MKRGDRRRLQVGGRRGFGLIEALISAALILMLIMGTAQLLAFSLAAKRRADFHFAAASLAAAKLEVLKSLDYQSPELGAGTHEELLTDGPTGMTYRVEWTAEAAGEAAKKVVLFISPSAKPAWKAEFCLLVCRELGF